MKTLILYLGLCFVTIFSYGQKTIKLTGSIVDKQSKYPIEYANIAIYNLPDSSLVKGGITNGTGQFNIEINENQLTSLYIKASFIGYKSCFRKITCPKIGCLLLEEESRELAEIVVKKHRKIYKVKNGIINASVRNSILSKLGNANDVLAKMPFVIEDNGELNILGKGKPVIYIDNRKLREKDELRQLKSKQIKNVEIILNPGAEYDASISAVIKITTLQHSEEGFSGWVYSYADNARELSTYEAISLNYRKKGLDIFAYTNYDISKSKSNQITTTFFPFEEDNIKVQRAGFLEFQNKSYKLKGGFNYSVNENQSLGAWYYYKKGLKSPYYRGDFEVNAYTNYIPKDNYSLNSINNGDGDSQNLNVYYHNKLASNIVFHFDGDYVQGKNYSQSNTILGEGEVLNSNDIKDIFHSDHKLYAGNLWLKTKLLAGDILLGSESSYTENNQNYDVIDNGVGADIKGSINSSEQTNIAAYVNYSRAFGKIFCQAGLRYEHVVYDYFLNEVKQNEQSTIYNNLFPMLSVSYSVKDFSASLSYRNQIRRPFYHQLLSSVTYIDPYTYESGNPALKPAKLHITSLVLSWKKINLNFNYVDIKDVASRLLFHDENKPIVISKYINSKITIYDANLSYNTSFGFWHPSLTGGISCQDFRYKDKSYNKPLYTYKFGNLFDLSNDWLISLDFKGNTRGNRDMVYTKGNFATNCTVWKKLNKGQWEIKLGANDIFNTNRERWSSMFGDVFLVKWNDKDSQSIYASITFNFNATKSKYKGKNATKSEMNRL